jgi:DNA-binding transcriptional LysR family regulator
LGFYAHETYLAGRTGIGSDWKDYDWVGLDQSNVLIEGFHNAGIAVDKSFFTFRSDNQIVGLQAVLAGLGVGIAPKRVARQFPQLAQVMPRQKLPALPVWLTAHRELRDSARIRAVFDFLAEALGSS